MSSVHKNEETEAQLSSYFDWVVENKSNVIYSDVWEECKTTFNKKGVGSLRGYANNRDRDFGSLISCIEASNRLFGGLKRFLNFINRAVNALFSYALSGDRKTYRRYGFHYEINIYHAFEERFPDYYERYKTFLLAAGEYYSYSSLRTFYYYCLAEKYLPKSTSPRVLEVGGGMGNFAAHLIRSYSKIEYIIIDIPEIIPSSLSELSSSSGMTDVQFFLPHELDNYFTSDAHKKVLWILPSQMSKLEDLEFDFAANTESFAEMFPEVSQNYLDFISGILKKNAYFFSINRAMRMVGTDYSDFNALTSPFKYELPGCALTLNVLDEFRALLPKFQQEPNLLSVWKK